VDASQALIALSGAIPAIVAMWVVDHLDRKRPEPASLRRLVAFMGMLSVIPAVFLGLVAQNMVGDLFAPVDATYRGAAFKSFVVAAGVEEACKIAVVYWIVWQQVELDERLDGIVYASRAGLGFALVENVVYLGLAATTLEDQLTMWLLRAVFAVPCHAMWTGMIGAFAARRRFDDRGIGLLGGYLVAVAFHGFYDLALFAQQPLIEDGHTAIARVALAVPIALTIVSFFVLRRLARDALRHDDADAARLAVAAARPIA
jgi:RsiW-degrading membrane proteinase PrsW (M82 family)